MVEGKVGLKVSISSRSYYGDRTRSSTSDQAEQNMSLGLNWTAG